MGSSSSNLALTLGLCVLLMPLGGCSLAFHVDTWPFAAGDKSTTRLGCLEIGSRLVTDPAVPDSVPVVDVWFRSSCGVPVRLDLEKLHVQVKYGEHWTGVAAFDPKHEIRPALLDPDVCSHEAFAFFPPPGADVETPSMVCVDLSEVVHDLYGQYRSRSCYDFRTKRLLQFGDNK